MILRPIHGRYTRDGENGAIGEEEKVLTIEQVQEQFPVLTYKIWKSKRGKEGLSVAGGISANPQASSNVAILRQNQLTSMPVPERYSPSEPSGSMAPSSPFTPIPIPADPVGHKPDDRQYGISAGDNCAICLETINDDDSIRGLKCSHCFHQTCIDPWLTSRRSACPLCKRDYSAPSESSTSAESTHQTIVFYDDQITSPPPSMWRGFNVKVRNLWLAVRGLSIFRLQRGGTSGDSERNGNV